MPDTPDTLGDLAVDRDFVDALATRARQDCFGSELAHRVEHSIELQAVFLRYLFAGRRDVRIVPVLTSFAHEAMHGGRRPDDDDPGVELVETDARQGVDEVVGVAEVARPQKALLALVPLRTRQEPHALLPMRPVGRMRGASRTRLHRS
jgi:hypothetical protein